MVTERSVQSGPRIFYGWFVVAGAFAVTFVGFGSAYTFSAFIESLQRDFAASRGSVSLVFSVAGFLYFALGLISGPLADRFGARLLAVTGMLLTGAGLAIASVARSLPEVYAAYGLGVGLGIGLSYVPILGAVQRWFVRRRGLASGLAVSGIGVGTLVMACGTPVIAFNRGSAAEVVDDGLTGFVVEDEAGAIGAVDRLGHLSRDKIRRQFEARFTARRMAQDYLSVYRSLIEGVAPHLRLVSEDAPAL